MTQLFSRAFVAALECVVFSLVWFFCGVILFTPFGLGIALFIHLPFGFDNAHIFYAYTALISLLFGPFIVFGFGESEPVQK